MRLSPVLSAQSVRSWRDHAGLRSLRPRGADKAITDAIDAHVQGEQRGADDDDEGQAGTLVPAG